MNLLKNKGDFPINATVAHEPLTSRAAYFIMYVRILGKSFGKFIWDFIGNLALVYINVWSGGRLLKGLLTIGQVEVFFYKKNLNFFRVKISNLPKDRF